MSVMPFRTLNPVSAGVAGLGLIVATSPVAATMLVSRDSSPAAKAKILDCRHQRPMRPELRSGDCIIVVAGGFKPAESIKTRLQSAPDTPVLVRADRAGVVRYRMVVREPANRRADVLTLVGLGRATGSTAGTHNESANLIVAVPRFAIVPFTVRGRH
ncbi:hypothetical protein ACSMXN_03840 [Jatrophihabitans sp. DSM 45814]